MAAYRVLLVARGRAIKRTIAAISQTAGYDLVAADGSGALDRAAMLQPDVALVEVASPDFSGIHLLRCLRHAAPKAACLAVSRCRRPAVLIEAMRAGACDWVRQPVAEHELRTALERALAHAPKPQARCIVLVDYEQHAHQRLAERAVQFIGSATDAPTVRQFARAIGCSVGGFRNWCRTAGVRARRYVHLARALRAVYRCQRDPSESLENLLQIIDRRTFAKFVTASGGARDKMPSTVEELLARQQLISPQAATAIRERLVTARFVITPLDAAAASSGAAPESRGH